MAPTRSAAPGGGGAQTNSSTTDPSARDRRDKTPLEAIDAVTALKGVKLTMGERFTLVMLARRHPNCHPGLRLLAREVGSDRANVGRWLDALEEKGLVESYYRYADGRAERRPPRSARGGRDGCSEPVGKRRPTEYRITLPTSGCQTQPHRLSGATATGCQTQPEEQREEQEKSNACHGSRKRDAAASAGAFGEGAVEGDGPATSAIAADPQHGSPADEGEVVARSPSPREEPDALPDEDAVLREMSRAGRALALAREAAPLLVGAGSAEGRHRSAEWAHNAATSEHVVRDLADAIRTHLADCPAEGTADTRQLVLTAAERTNCEPVVGSISGAFAAQLETEAAT